MQRVPEIQKLVSDWLLYSHMPSPTSEFAVEKAKPRSMNPVRMIYEIHFTPKFRTLLISDVLFKLISKGFVIQKQVKINASKIERSLLVARVKFEPESSSSPESSASPLNENPFLTLF